MSVLAFVVRGGISKYPEDYYIRTQNRASQEDYIRKSWDKIYKNSKSTLAKKKG